MDVTKSAALAKADVASSIVDTVSVNLIEVITPLLDQTPSSSTSEEGGIMETTRIKLFMKYVGIEYEVLAKGIHRDDTYGIYVG